jgi:hypothetical protein
MALSLSILPCHRARRLRAAPVDCAPRACGLCALSLSKGDSPRARRSARFWVAPQILGFDPRLPPIGPAYSAPPFPALAYPIVKASSSRPRRCLDLDGWPDLAPFVGRSLSVLVVDDIHVHGHLAGLVFSKIDSAPAHHAPVVDAPPSAADVSRLKPHTSIRTRMRLILISKMRPYGQRTYGVSSARRALPGAAGLHALQTRADGTKPTLT